MRGFALFPGLQFIMDDQKYLVRKNLDNDDVELTNLSYDNIVEIFSMNELLVAWSEKRLIPKNETTDQMMQRLTDSDLLSSEEREIMENRYNVLHPVINGEIKPADIQNYVDSLPNNLKSSIGSVSMLYKWKKKYLMTGDKRSLISTDRFKKRGYYTDSINVAIIEKILRAEEKKGLQTGIRDKWIELKEQIKEYNRYREEADQIKPCSQTTVFRIVQDKTNSYQKDKSRHGPVQAALNQRGSTTELEVTRPMQRVEVDWTPLDLFIVDLVTLRRERHYLIYAIDVFSDYPLGFYICSTEPSTKDIKQCLLHAMLPKLHLKKLYPQLKHDWAAFGLPELVVVDNAKVNESGDLKDLLAMIGVELQYCPVQTGHHKGTIERGLKSVNDTLHQYPGTTFSNPKERSQYKSEKNACIDLLTLYNILHIIFIEKIANNYSIAVEGTPDFVWKEGLKEAKVHRKLPYSKEELIILLGTGIEYRKIDNKGIEIQSQHYTSPLLRELADRKNRRKDKDKVRVRFDMADMRTVYIYDEENQQYIEAYPTRNSLKNKKINDSYPVHYDQLHAYSYNNEKAYRDFDTSDLASANRAIEKLITESKERLKKIEQLPKDVRAEIMAKNLAAIQVTFDAQLAPSDLESIRLVDESLENIEDNKQTLSKRKKRKDNTKTIKKELVNPIVKETITEDFDIELEEYETVTRKKIE